MDELLKRMEQIKPLERDDMVDFSYPDGFLAVAKSLVFLPDDATRIQMLTRFLFTSGMF